MYVLVIYAANLNLKPITQIFRVINVKLENGFKNISQLGH
jgi:hypothetical protein